MRSPRSLAVRAAMTLALVVALAGLSACGGLPSVSAVQQGSRVGEPALQPVRVQPDGPAAGATAEQMVRGFLRAGAAAGFDDDHAVARSFFTRGVRDQWQPDSGVKVYGDDSAVKVVLLSPGTLRVTAGIVAEVDSAGNYREMPAGSVARADFGVKRLGVGWRIVKPPKGFGLWLSAADLDRTYGSFAIAYVSKVAPIIVGDRRWFPVTPGLVTTLARAQLSPVPAYLIGAAQTGVPRGTALVLDSVPILAGRAVVDLSGSATSASPQLRRAMWAQFVTTLMQLASVTEVSLEVNGAGLNLPDTSDRVSGLTTLGYRTDFSASFLPAILRAGSVLTRVSSDRPSERDRPQKAPSSAALPKIPVGWVSLALSRDGHEIAAVGGDHVDLARWQGTRFFQLPAFGTMLTKPSYDSLKGLWLAGEAGGTAKVWVIDTSLSPMAKAKPRGIPAPWLVNRRVVALKVAADNQRMAVITTDRAGGDVRLVVVGIVRSAGGMPLSLAAQPLRVGWTLTAATDLAWVDDSTLAVVGRVRPRDVIGPQLVEVGGRVTSMPPAVGTRSVTNTGGLRGVVVITGANKILARAGIGWQVLQTGTDFLIPGG